MSVQPIYGEGAQRYAAHAGSGAIYAEYERPNIRALAGAVRDLSVLDLGCGPGSHFAWLLAHGAARVAGADGSLAMLEICRARFPGVPVHDLDLRERWSFACDGEFDLVMSSLALHYVSDWSVALREAHRVLLPGGRFVVSTHHPANPGVLALLPASPEQVQEVRDRWSIDGAFAEVRYYHRQMNAILTAFEDGGFRIARMLEPKFNGTAMFLFLDAER